jgi:hypothetical protein
MRNEDIRFQNSAPSDPRDLAERFEYTDLRNNRKTSAVTAQGPPIRHLRRDHRQDGRLTYRRNRLCEAKNQRKKLKPIGCVK